MTKADKGNKVVIMERLDYQNKMDLLLNDTGTYQKLDKNPFNKIKDKCKEIVKRWKMKEYISEQTFRSLNITDCNLPRAYGLPKIHKPDNPLRIIISSLDSPTYNMASFL